MKKYIYNLMIGIACLGIPSLTSCSSDYLETAPTESVNAVDALATAENAYSALNGIARTMTCQQYAWSQGCAGETRIISIYENYPSQDYLYNYYASGWSPIMNLQYSLRTNTSYTAYPYYYYYTIIGQANSILAKIDEATGDENMIAFVKGSALTYRAYAYEKLLHYYAPRWQDSNNGSAEGVVLRLDESIGSQAPSDMATCYKQIYEDCTNAINAFQSASFNRPTTSVWIANENVAHAVYARAALNRQDYSTALSQAKLAREGFPLMNNMDYQSGFCRPTSEWIFGSYGDATENQWYWSYGTQYSCNGYYSYASACGAGAINKTLYQQIPDNDARKALFLTEDKFSSWSTEIAKERYYPSYGIIGLFSDDLSEEIYDYIMELHQATTPAMSAPYGLDSYDPNDWGYFYDGGQLKFFVFDTPGVHYMPFIRSSEMVLIEAEANYFLNNEADAQAALEELNASTERNPDYVCSKTGNDLFEEIVNYRALELWGEGFGYSDYKRWNRDIVRVGFAAGGNAAAAIAVTIKASDPNWVWAVPQYETDFNDAYRNTGSADGK